MKTSSRSGANLSRMRRSKDSRLSFPLSEDEFIASVCPAGILAGRSTKGSANPACVAEMIKRAKNANAAIAEELCALREKRSSTDDILDETLKRLLRETN